MKDKTNHSTKWSWILVAFFVLLCAPNLLAATYEFGEEYQVNTEIAPIQFNPAIAADTNGNFVIVWEGGNYPGEPGYGIYGRKFNSNLTPAGGEFHINTYTTDDQRYPAIAMDADGDFAVVWQSIGQDGSGGGIYGQRFNSSTVAQGSEFRINSPTTYNQLHPDVAMDASGNFVAVWDSEWTGYDGHWEGVFGQRYNADGSKAGGEFLVNTITQWSQARPAVAMEADGDFIVAWQSATGTYDYEEIRFQRYAANGSTVGVETTANTYLNNPQVYPDIAIAPDGSFLIVWQSLGQDGSGYGLYGQRFAANGTPIGSEFAINTVTSGDQADVTVAYGPTGEFIIGWVASDGHGSGVFARAYDANGVPLDATEFRVNSYTTSTQTSPAVVWDDITIAMAGTSSVDDTGIFFGHAPTGDPGGGAVPEPATVVSMLLGGAGLAAKRFMRNKVRK